MKKIKCVICDIDSTLVVKHQMLTPKAKKIIEQLREQGVYFGVASGRPLYQIKDAIHQWGFDDFDVIIGLNGSTLWDGVDKKEYNYYVMKKEWIKETLELMAPFESNPSIYRGDTQYFYKEDEFMKLYKEMTQLKVATVNSIEEFYQEETAKIMFRVDETIMPEVEKWVKEHPSSNFVGFKTQPMLMEFCDKHINKGYALKKFCEYQQFSLDEVIAFGDTTNDNEMIAIAGMGICMHNGSDDTKAIADFITEKDCDDDGWADYMENHILK